MRIRLDHAVPVREPLVLISQVQRSGGTLLSQLFDGAPGVPRAPARAVHRQAEQVGLAAARPRRPRELVRDALRAAAAERVPRGLREGPNGAGSDEHDVFPFLFLPRLQQRDLRRVRRGGGRRARARRARLLLHLVLQRLARQPEPLPGPKRVGHRLRPAPGDGARRMSSASSPPTPTGSLVSIVRDPRGWYASARRHRTYYADLDEAIGLWRASTRGRARARPSARPDRVARAHLRAARARHRGDDARLAERIGIAMTPVLLVPTFNWRPIRANSSAAVERTGIIAERAERLPRGCSRRTRSPQIERLAGDLYERATPVSFAT